MAWSAKHARSHPRRDPAPVADSAMEDSGAEGEAGCCPRHRVQNAEALNSDGACAPI